MNPTLKKILVGASTTILGAAVVWAVPYQVKHNQTVDANSTQLAQLNNFKKQTPQLFASAEEFTTFRDRAYYRWNESEIDRLRERQIRLSEKRHLSDLEKQWLRETESRLKNRLNRRSILQKRLDKNVLVDAPNH